MVKMITKVMIVFLCSLIFSSVMPLTEVVKEEEVKYIYIPHNVYIERTDTFYKTPDGAFKSIDDYISFIKYIKTQSGRIDDDNWAVMQVISNRMRNKECDWRTYYNTPSINHSHSISLMRSGKLYKRFDWNNDKDIEFFRRALLVSFGEAEYPIDSNIGAFESYKVSPNRGVHLKKNLAFKLRHKFYYTY